MKYYLILGIIIGLGLIIFALFDLKKLGGKIKAKATVLGKHSDGRDNYITRVAFIYNNKQVECDLNFYTIFWRKGKQINIYYNPSKYYEIFSIHSNIFLLNLGLVFLVFSIYCIIFV